LTKEYNQNEKLIREWDGFNVLIKYAKRAEVIERYKKKQNNIGKNIIW
jgi:hypothetical protein